MKNARFLLILILPKKKIGSVCLTRYCQNSFINVLESGYFLNNGDKIGLLFILDFNTKTVCFFSQDYDKKITEYNKASIDEIMNFEDMSIKTYN